MTKLTVLHLSDFHYSEEKWADSKLIVAGLCADIKQQIAEGVRAPDICVFSGDLFQAGGPEMPIESFKERVLSPLMDAAGLTVDEVFACTGNHDIDREVVRNNRAIQSGMLSTLTDRDELNKFYDKQSTEPAAPYFSRLTMFHQFTQSLGSNSLINQNNFYSTYKFTLPDGAIVGVATFNTAWLSSGEEGDIDRGKMLLPERAIFAAIDDLKGSQITIATHHHPLDYLADYCRFDARALLHKEFNLVCYGHMHQAMPLLTRSIVGEAVSSEAGALYTWRGYYNGYCFVTIDTDNRSVAFRHRKWADSPAYKFVSANELSDTGETVFFWGDPTQVSIDKAVIDVNRSYYGILESLANEHLLSSHTTTTAPKIFSDLYVDVPLSVRKAEGEDAGGQTEYISIEELLAGEGPQIVFGNREAGKTSLGYSVALSVCASVEAPIRIPVMVDLEKMSSSSNALRREAQKMLLATGIADQIANMLGAGSFVFIIDNFSPNDIRRATVINEFVKLYPKNKFILLADERGTPFEVRTKSHLEMETRNLSLHPLKRKQVRELTRRWLGPSGLYTNDAFHAVLKKIQNSGLPTTAYVVSMIAWTLERQNLNTNVNEATLLERFVEAILNKADSAEVSRATLDFTIRESFLAELAFHLRKSNSYTLALSDLDELATGFIKERGWLTNAANFVRQLIQTGILIEVDEVVSFRYRCLREYFLAKFILEDEEYRDIVLSEDQYLDFAREIDILTGLQRKDKALLRSIIDYTDRRVAAGFEPVDLAAFDSTGFRFGGDGSVLARPKSLSDLGLDDDVVEGMLDSADADARPARVRGDLEEGRQPPSKQRIHDLSTAYASMILLSKVVRNSELIKDMDLKSTAVIQAMTHWGQFIGYMVTSFDKAVDTVRDEHNHRPIDKLDDDQKKFLEHFIKIMLPLVFSSAVHSSLGTEKLRSIYEDIVDQSSGQPTIVRLLTAFLLVDVSFLDRSEAAADMIKKVELFTKGNSSRFVLELICHKLLVVYNTPNLGDKNRGIIEKLYAETQLRLHGVNSQSPRYGTQKSGIMLGMRKQAVGDDDDG
jgi:predicted MPP superfamily phosphohydrolase